jgi:undecaprenyl-diphosphatase
VGLFVLISYWSVIAGDPGPTPGDQAAVDFFNSIRTSWLDDLAKAVTHLGSGWVVYPLAVLGAIALAIKRRWPEFWVLVVGMALIAFFVPEIKSWTDRPRPPDGVISVGGSAFPSGHAAQSTFYAWLAVTLAFRIAPGVTRRSLLIAAGIALTALIGITRVYLQVHWLSDVTAGWALGVSAFTAAAGVALVLVHIRDNSRRDVRAPKRDPGADPGGRD